MSVGLEFAGTRRRSTEKGCTSVPFMMKQHTRGLAETKDNDLDGDEEVQECSA
jgi:hypothetical protein